MTSQIKTLATSSLLCALLLLFVTACASMPRRSPSWQSPPGHEEGERLFRRKCVECHGLYSPQRYSDREWRATLDDMAFEAQLNDEQKALILGFLLAANDGGKPAASSPR